MDQQILTQEFIEKCLSTSEDYQQSKLIKDSVRVDQKEQFQMILETIQKIIDDETSAPICQLMTLRVQYILRKLCKDLMDIKNSDFAELFEQNILFKLKPIAEYDMQSQDDDRGKKLFNKRADLANYDNKYQIIMSNSILRLTLDCIQAWASYFPQDFRMTDRPSTFLKFYIELIKKGVSFPPLAYFKELEQNIYNPQAYNGMLQILEDQDPELHLLLPQKREYYKPFQEQIVFNDALNQKKEDLKKQQSSDQQKLKEELKFQSSNYRNLKEVNQQLIMENANLRDLVNFQRSEITRLTKLTEEQAKTLNNTQQ